WPDPALSITSVAPPAIGTAHVTTRTSVRGMRSGAVAREKLRSFPGRRARSPPPRGAPVPVILLPSVRARPRGLARLFIAGTLLMPTAVAAQMAATLAVPPDSSRWIFEGQAGVKEYLGRRCVMLDG